MDSLFNVGTGISVIILIAIIVFGLFFIIVSILLPFNVFIIKDVLKEINNNLIKNNQMSVYNNKRLKEVISILEKNAVNDVSGSDVNNSESNKENLVVIDSLEDLLKDEKMKAKLTEVKRFYGKEAYVRSVNAELKKLGLKEITVDDIGD